MASQRFAHRLFLLANAVPVRSTALRDAEHVGKGVCAVRSHAKPRTMASAAQELAPQETENDSVSCGRPNWRGGRHSALRVFDVFDSFFPNRNLRSMIHKMDRMFDDPFFANSKFGDRAGAFLESRRPPWDLLETDDSFRMRLDVPGLSKEEVKVYVEDGNLVIKGEHSDENKADEALWSSSSRRSSYSTRIVLPDNANAEGIKAELKNGVLFVTLPKLPEAKKSVIDVAID